MQLIDSRERLGPCQSPVELPPLVPAFADAATLYLVGHPNRGRNMRAYLAVGARFFTPLPSIPALPPNVIGLHIDDVYATHLADRLGLRRREIRSPILIVVSDDEPAEIVVAVLGMGAPSADAIAVAEADECCLDSDSTWVSVAAGKSAASFFPTPAEYGIELTKKLDEMEMKRDPKTGACRFFAKMDALSNPKLGAVPAQMLAPITTLLDTLPRRLSTRRFLCTDCSMTPCSPWQGPAITPGTTLHNAVSAVSPFMLDLMKKYLSDPATDIAPIEKAFEQFSNGELRVPLDKYSVWTTQPSSAFYFFFAEFAFLANEASVSASIWESLANVFVRTQPVFCNAYKPGPSSSYPPPFGDYRACNYCRNSPLADVSSLRREYKGLSLDDLRSRAACNARMLFTP